MNTKTQSPVTKAMQAYARRITGGRQSVSGESIMVPGAFVSVKASKYSYSSHPATCAIVPLSECNGETSGMVMFDCDAVTLAAFDHIMDNLDRIGLTSPHKLELPGAAEIVKNERKVRGHDDVLATGHVTDGFIYVTDSFSMIRYGAPKDYDNIGRMLVDLPKTMLGDLQVAHLRDGDLPMLRQDILVAVSQKAGVLVMYACQTGRPIPNLHTLMERTRATSELEHIGDVMDTAKDVESTKDTKDVIMLMVSGYAVHANGEYMRNMEKAMPWAIVGTTGPLKPITFHSPIGDTIMGLCMPIRHKG